MNRESILNNKKYDIKKFKSIFKSRNKLRQYNSTYFKQKGLELKSIINRECINEKEKSLGKSRHLVHALRRQHNKKPEPHLFPTCLQETEYTSNVG